MPASLLIATGWLFAAGAASAADVSAYVEFLWSPPAENSIARQETRGFVLDGKQQHQVCVAALDPLARPDVLRIEASDASGRMVSSQDYADFSGKKRCFPAQLNKRGEPGEWTFKVYLDGKLAATKTIEVATRLETALFYAPSLVPYVLGRPNYDPAIPADQFVGRLIWVMQVDAGGAVTGVEVELAEGVGVLMKERAIAAGHMSLFPPDGSRKAAATYRRELVFKPD